MKNANFAPLINSCNIAQNKSKNKTVVLTVPFTEKDVKSTTKFTMEIPPNLFLKKFRNKNMTLWISWTFSYRTWFYMRVGLYHPRKGYKNTWRTIAQGTFVNLPFPDIKARWIECWPEMYQLLWRWYAINSKNWKCRAL